MKASTAPRAESGFGTDAAEAARAVIAQADAILLDWDGCVALGNRPQPGALAFLARHRDRAAIVSNNSSNLPEDFARILAQAGLVLSPSRILLAGHEALARASRGGPGKALVLGDGRMRAHARKLGLTLVREDAELVVLLRDTRFSYSRLEAAANSLNRGARLLVANPDLTHPGAHGRITPETGALLAALAACLPPGALRMEVIGKPGPHLFQMAMRTLGAAPERTVMIGDNPSTDIAGAAALGLAGILIGPGSGLTFEDLLDPDDGTRSPLVRNRSRVRTA